MLACRVPFLNSLSSLNKMCTTNACTIAVNTSMAERHWDERSLFFTSQEQVELMRCYPDIVLMDSTNKSNRYTCLCSTSAVSLRITHTTYSTTFTFMSRESEEDFYWAFDQFKRLVHFDLQPPKCFITDNDKGMRKALSQVFDCHRCYVPGISSRMFFAALS